MPNREFDEFVKRQKAASQESQPVDWDARRKEWLQHIQALYSLVDGFLKDYIESGEIHRRFDDTVLTEDFIGSYTAPVMFMMIGPQEVKLVPMGTLVIGAKGRVDLIGPRGQVRLVLVDKDSPRSIIRIEIGKGESQKPTNARQVSNWAWKIATPPPSVRYNELNQDSFMEAVMEVVNG